MVKHKILAVKRDDIWYHTNLIHELNVGKSATTGICQHCRKIFSWKKVWDKRNETKGNIRCHHCNGRFDRKVGDKEAFY